MLLMRTLIDIIYVLTVGCIFLVFVITGLTAYITSPILALFFMFLTLTIFAVMASAAWYLLVAYARKPFQKLLESQNDLVLFTYRFENGPIFDFKLNSKYDFLESINSKNLLMAFKIGFTVKAFIDRYKKMFGKEIYNIFIDETPSKNQETYFYIRENIEKRLILVDREFLL